MPRRCATIEGCSVAVAGRLTWRLSRSDCHEKADGVIVLLAILILGIGFVRGWFQVSTVNGDHETKATITVDKDKIRADEELAKEKVQEFEHKAK